MSEQANNAPNLQQNPESPIRLLIYVAAVLAVLLGGGTGHLILSGKTTSKIPTPS
jgi:hypothetical protein